MGKKKNSNFDNYNQLFGAKKTQRGTNTDNYYNLFKKKYASEQPKLTDKQKYAQEQKKTEALQWLDENTRANREAINIKNLRGTFQGDVYEQAKSKDIQSATEDLLKSSKYMPIADLYRTEKPTYEDSTPKEWKEYVDYQKAVADGKASKRIYLDDLMEGYETPEPVLRAQTARAAQEQVNAYQYSQGQQRYAELDKQSRAKAAREAEATQRIEEARLSAPKYAEAGVSAYEQGQKIKGYQAQKQAQEKAQKQEAERLKKQEEAEQKERERLSAEQKKTAAKNELKQMEATTTEVYEQHKLDALADKQRTFSQEISKLAPEMGVYEAADYLLKQPSYGELIPFVEDERPTIESATPKQWQDYTQYEKQAAEKTKLPKLYLDEVIQKEQPEDESKDEHAGKEFGLLADLANLFGFGPGTTQTSGNEGAPYNEQSRYTDALQTKGAPQNSPESPGLFDYAAGIGTSDASEQAAAPSMQQMQDWEGAPTPQILAALQAPEHEKPVENEGDVNAYLTYRMQNPGEDSFYSGLQNGIVEPGAQGFRWGKWEIVPGKAQARREATFANLPANAKSKVLADYATDPNWNRSAAAEITKNAVLGVGQGMAQAVGGITGGLETITGSDSTISDSYFDTSNQLQAQAKTDNAVAAMANTVSSELTRMFYNSLAGTAVAAPFVASFGNNFKIFAAAKPTVAQKAANTIAKWIPKSSGMMAGAYTNYSREAKQDGASDLDATMYGLVGMLTEGVTEGIVGNFIFDNAIGSLKLGKLFASGAAQKGLKGYAKQAGAATLDFLLKTMGEGAEELTSSIVSDLAAKGIYDPERTADFDKALQSAAMGAIIGGVGGGLSMPGTIAYWKSADVVQSGDVSAKAVMDAAKVTEAQSRSPANPSESYVEQMTRQPLSQEKKIAYGETISMIQTRLERTQTDGQKKVDAETKQYEAIRAQVETDPALFDAAIAQGEKVLAVKQAQARIIEDVQADLASAQRKLDQAVQADNNVAFYEAYQEQAAQKQEEGLERALQEEVNAQGAEELPTQTPVPGFYVREVNGEGGRVYKIWSGDPKGYSLPATNFEYKSREEAQAAMAQLKPEQSPFSLGSIVSRMGNFVSETFADKQSNAKIRLRELAPGEVQRIKDVSGVDLSGYSYSVGASDLRHIIKHHGDSGYAVEAQRGQVKVTAGDLKLIPFVLDSPDAIDYMGKTEDMNAQKDSFQFTKRIENDYIAVLIAGPNSRNKKTLSIKTMYIKEIKQVATPSTTSETGYLGEITLDANDATLGGQGAPSGFTSETIHLGEMAPNANNPAHNGSIPQAQTDVNTQNQEVNYEDFAGYGREFADEWQPASAGYYDPSSAEIAADFARATEEIRKTANFEGRVVARQEIAPELEKRIGRLEKMTGSAPILYESEGNFGENSFLMNGKIYLRTNGKAPVEYAYGHEYAHLNGNIAEQVQKTVDISTQTEQAYLQYRKAIGDNAPMENVREELISDFTGKLFYQALTGKQFDHDMGLDPQTAANLADTIVDAIAGTKQGQFDGTNENVDMMKKYAKYEYPLFSKGETRLFETNEVTQDVLSSILGDAAAIANGGFNAGETYRNLAKSDLGYTQRRNLIAKAIAGTEQDIGAAYYKLIDQGMNAGTAQKIINSARRIQKANYDGLPVTTDPNTFADTILTTAIEQGQTDLPTAYLAMIKDGYTGDKANRVIKVARGMLLENNIDVGGALGQGKLDALTKNANSWKSKGQWSFTRETPMRNLEDIARWRVEDTPEAIAANHEEAEQLKHAFVDPIADANTNIALFKNKYKEQVRALALNQSESIVTQILGEKNITKDAHIKLDAKGSGVIAEGDKVLVFKDGNLLAVSEGENTLSYAKDKKLLEFKRETIRNDPNLSSDQKNVLLAQLKKVKSKGVKYDSAISVMNTPQGVTAYLNGQRLIQAQPQQTDMVKVDKAIELMRSHYGAFIENANRVRIENGYKPIPTVTDYFPHIGQSAGGMDKFIEAINDDLPASIAGLTGQFKPGTTWFSNFETRLGGQTNYDAVRGYDKYVDGVADVIYTTPALQRIRQFEQAVRDTGTGKNNSALAVHLAELGNTIANKKSSFDRGAESALGRGVLKVSGKMI